MVSQAEPLDLTHRHIAGERKGPLATLGRKLLVGLPLILLAIWTFLPFAVASSPAVRLYVVPAW